MRTRIIPAQITTVEDKIAGSLSMTQILIMMIPVGLTAVIYVLLAPSMKLVSYKLILIIALMITTTSAFAVERLLGRTVLDDRTRGETVNINTCNGPRDQKLRSLTLRIRGDGVDLRRVNAIIEDISGRSTPLGLNIRPGIYRGNSILTVQLPRSLRCMRSVQIIGDSLGGGDDRRIGRGTSRGGRGRGPVRHTVPSIVEIWGDVRF